jgi:hypothetical protein
MPTNDPYQNAPHLGPRLAVPDGSHPQRIGQHETSAAIALEQLIRDGDLGGVRRFLHEAEHQLGPWRPDPWRLLEHVAARAIAAPPGDASGAPGAGPGSEGGERGWSPPAPDRPAPGPAPGPETADRL